MWYCLSMQDEQDEVKKDVKNSGNGGENKITRMIPRDYGNGYIVWEASLWFGFGCDESCSMSELKEA